MKGDSLLFLIVISAGLLPADAMDQSTPLPEPLTLEYALSLANELAPPLRRATAQLQVAQAERVIAGSGYATTLSMSARLRTIRSAESGSTLDDHRVGFRVNRGLYDFGLTRSRLDAADASIEARHWHLIEARDAQRLRVMAAYFDVLLADLEYVRDNEAMSIAFIHFDRIQDAHELRQVSDVELFESETAYQQSRHSRFVSAGQQRATRSRLAIALNRPEELSSELALPELDSLARPLPEVEDLTQQALSNSPTLRALQAELTAAESEVEVADAGDGPVLSGVATLSEFTRETANGDRWQFGLEFEMPLYDSGQTHAQVAHARAAVSGLQAELAERRHELRQAVLDIWLELDGLGIRREGLEVQYDFRDLYLDRSRALYELEAESDLGDAMVRVSDHRLQAAEVSYRMVLLWAQLDALVTAHESLLIPGEVM
ncbi:MAG TPA: TolC family protein [Chromatiales bacterium]|nr:TolC family protein [Chromatiales bacterium]